MMDEKRIYNAITRIDDDLLDKSINGNAKKTVSNAARIRIVAIAACLTLIVAGAIFAVPNLLRAGKGHAINPPADNTSAVSVVKSGNRITGRQELVYGDYSSLSDGAAEMLPPCFYIQTVIEAEVVEVLPDTYYYAASYSQPNHVVKLRVVDQVRGDGMPGEIYLRYPYYDTMVFDGYERFIMSVEQVGTDNFALINDTQGRVDFFPNMFVVTTGDIGYGSVIAFKDGRVDSSFWDKTDYNVSRIPRGKELFNALFDYPKSNYYPATRKETIGNVKNNIIKLAADGDNWRVSTNRYNYVTVDDVFVSPEAKAIKPYLEPNEGNVFVHYLSPREDRVVAEYTRIINGFLTDETIVINGYDGENGNVSRSIVCYTAENLSKVPDIGNAIENIDLSNLAPLHIEVTSGMELAYSNASGIYRNIGGKVYGIIRVMWYYRSPEYKNGLLPDDMYYLYDENGNGSIIEREELKSIIGDDSFIRRFPYGSVMVVSK